MKNLKVYFQSLGVLFEYNLGLTSSLAAYKDLKITVEITDLLLYLYSICFRQYYSNIKFIMTQPIIAPVWKKGNNKIANFVSRSSYYRKLISKFDVLHLSQIEHPYTRAAVEIERPKVLTLGYFPFRLDDRLKGTIMKMDALIAPSKFLSKLIYEMHGCQSTVIYHGVATSVFNTMIPKTEARKHLRLPASKRVIYWNSRLDPDKDLKTLIDAVPIVAREIPNSLFLIKARSKQSNYDILRYVRKKVRKNRIEQNVRMMTGWDFLTKMPYYYRSADVFAHTCLFESFGFVLVEAMACGVPIVAYNAATAPEIVGDAGLLSEPKNPEDLADKIIRLLSDEKLRTRLSEKGLNRISELGLTWEKAAEQYRKLYLSVT